MCVAAMAWNCHPQWLLVVAGNRDEHHNRPSSPLAPWPDHPSLIAGKDLTGGGTWLGVSEQGRFTLVTNYRVPEGPKPNLPSRGRLVTDLLDGAELETQIERATQMNPFNLFHVADGHAQFLSSYPEVTITRVTTGIHGLSNGGIDTPWPKTLALQHALAQWLAHAPSHSAPSVEALFTALRSESVDLPPASQPHHTPEPQFAPVFIHNPNYGTRCSTVLLVDHQGQGRIVERSYGSQGQACGEVQWGFTWPKAALAPASPTA